MTMWVAVLLGCAACYALKLVGYLVPGSWLEGERTSRITTLLPVALLAALIVTQTFGGSQGTLVLDARIAAVAVAIALLLARANFVVVVLAGAVVAASLRALGIG
ncbi:MAG: AzlD domain-containing protein [Phycicoccus sp.]|nr:AzlD domain-containing protein [Phycicoccus sp.]